jgi:hypothetical protein
MSVMRSCNSELAQPRLLRCRSHGVQGFHEPSGWFLRRSADAGELFDGFRTGVHDTLKLRPQMPNNLLIWPNLQPTELMILLHECMGGTWQGDLSVRKPRKLYIPMFGPTCRVILKFDGPKIVAIEPGEGFDPNPRGQGGVVLRAADAFKAFPGLRAADEARC